MSGPQFILKPALTATASSAAAAAALAYRSDADRIISGRDNAATGEIDGRRTATAAETAIACAAGDAVSAAAMAAIASIAGGNNAGGVIAGCFDRAIDVDDGDAAIGAIMAVTAIGEHIAVAAIAALAPVGEGRQSPNCYCRMYSRRRCRRCPHPRWAGCN